MSENLDSRYFIVLDKDKIIFFVLIVKIKFYLNKIMILLIIIQ